MEFNENGAARNDELSTRFSGLIRTRTFGVNGDMLWYRYKGKADVFMAVNSHRQVAGPLHLDRPPKLDSKGDEWKWHGHRVRDYIGFRVHVEFTCAATLRSSGCSSANRTAGDPPGELALGQAAGERHRQLGLGRRVCSAATDLAGGKAGRETAQLLNWVIRHDKLLERPADLGQAAASFAAYQKQRSDIEKSIPGASWALTLLDGSGEMNQFWCEAITSHRRRNWCRDHFWRPWPSARRPAAGVAGWPWPGAWSTLPNPFVSRVVVNRLWHHLFGRGIVETVDNLGATGKAPTHPDLLDFLASQLMERDWSLKDIIRQVVLSSTYRQSSKPNMASAKVDPNNYLLHRMPIRRLQGEVIRDRLLAVSGRIDKRQFGKGRWCISRRSCGITAAPAATA